jgi:SET and MYND domain-containing protein 4
LCHAEIGSENLSLAYANRAAVYLEVKEVDKCLENIELARAHGYANEAKLKEREEKAKKLKENLVEDPENDPKNFFKLSYPAHERNPSIANCLEIHKNEQFGRHVVTNQDLNPGDVIAVEEPMFKRILDCARYLRCSNCLKPNMLSLIPCDKDCNFGKQGNQSCLFCSLFAFISSLAMFCDQKCLTQGWTRFHQFECNDGIGKLRELSVDGIMDPPMDLRSVSEAIMMAGSVKRLRKLTATPNTNGNVLDLNLSHERDESIDLKHLKVLSMLKPRDNEKEIEERDCNEIERTLLICFSEFRKLFASSTEHFEFVRHCLKRFPSIHLRNSFGFGFDNDKQADGTLPFGSFFDHSCDPNVIAVAAFENKIAFIVAMPVKKGEQLFVSSSNISIYNEPSTRNRQQALRENFRFKCSCFPCSNNWNVNTIQTLPIYDRNFPLPLLPNQLPLKFKDAVREFKENCDYIKKNFTHYPSNEIFAKLFRNILLVYRINDLALWPTHQSKKFDF